MKSLIFLAAALILALPAATSSQSSPRNPLSSIASDTRIRLRGVGTYETIVGYLVFAGADTIVFTDADGRVHRLKTSSIARADTAAGRRSMTAEGLLMGVAIGAGAGGFLGAVFYSPCEGRFVCLSRAEQALFAGGGLGIIGGLIGAVVGSGKSGDRWSPIKLPRSAGVVLRPSRGGLKVGASIRFSSAALAR